MAGKTNQTRQKNEYKYFVDLVSKIDKEGNCGFERTEKINVKKELEYEKERIKNKALRQDIKLKGWTLLALFLFLLGETIAIFYFAYLQGTINNCFTLEEWSFKLLVTATILQITFMLQVAVKHLFPKKC